MNSISSTAPVNCPVCGTICSDVPLYRYTASEAAAHFCPTTRSADRHRRIEASIRKLQGGTFAMVGVAH